MVLLHIRGEKHEDILFRLVTPYAIHEIPLQYYDADVEDVCADSNFVDLLLEII